MGAAEDFVKQLLTKKGRTAGARTAVLPEAPRKAPDSLIGRTSQTSQTSLPGPVLSVPPEAPTACQEVKSFLVPAPNAAARRVLRRPAETHSDKERSLRDEKVEFVRLVEETKAVCHLSDQMAVLKVAAEKRDIFPLLSCAGKNGASALHYNNLRNWRDGRRKHPGLRDPVTGRVDFSRADLLLPNYGRDFHRYGDERFWTAILAACNNLGSPQIAKNYALLVRKFTAEAPDAKIPSLAQVRYELKKIPARLLDLNRKGPAWYLQHTRDYNERDPESVRPNEAWVGDTQQLDFLIRVETGKDPDGTPVFAADRPWICVLMDIKSEFVVAWEMGIGAIDNRVIRNAFGRAVAQYGRPMILLTDNGKDYLKQGFTTPVVFTPDIAGSKIYSHSILQALDIEHRRATAYNGRAKIVERFFSEMAKYYRTCRGYLGNSPASRPATAAVWSKPGTCAHLMNIEEACRTMADFIDIYHDTKAKGSKFLRGMTPREAFAEDRRMKRPALSMQELYRRFLMPEPKPRIVDARGSSVVVSGLRYVALREDREKMWRYDGRPVMVKFDLASREYCFLFDLDGTFLTVAHRPQMLPYFCRTPEERALLRQHQNRINSEIATLNTYTNDLTHGFHKLDVSTSFGLPPEEFDGRAGIAKLDTMHSVKGETHNPAVYIPTAEKRAAGRGEDIRRLPGKTNLASPTVAAVDPDKVRRLAQLLKNNKPDNF